ncbi:hypothetical protein L484_012361 [Morus notabilis]|uniref:Uncharacterized protein n=1 Tax=Morus notabilis TaxID=981085 RepID=W9S6G0_9ROSA|nr:hypothetical protein L484_012361 [Morus notabilis]
MDEYKNKRRHSSGLFQCTPNLVFGCNGQSVQRGVEIVTVSFFIAATFFAIVIKKVFKDERCSLDNASKKILHIGDNIKKGVFGCISPIGVCNPLILVDCSLSERDPADADVDFERKKQYQAKPISNGKTKSCDLRRGTAIIDLIRKHSTCMIACTKVGISRLRHK